jgi:hypothetical protein
MGSSLKPLQTAANSNGFIKSLIKKLIRGYDSENGKRYEKSGDNPQGSDSMHVRHIMTAPVNRQSHEAFGENRVVRGRERDAHDGS